MGVPDKFKRGDRIALLHAYNPSSIRYFECYKGNNDIEYQCVTPSKTGGIRKHLVVVPDFLVVPYTPPAPMSLSQLFVSFAIKILLTAIIPLGIYAFVEVFDP